MVSFAGDNVDELLITGDAELFESLEPSALVKSTKSKTLATSS